MTAMSHQTKGAGTPVDEGNLLGKKLSDLLRKEGVCTAPQACKKGLDHVVHIPHENGLTLAIFGVADGPVVQKLLQACAAAFFDRPLGDSMVVKVYEIPKLQHIRQSIFNRAQPFVIFKLERPLGDL